MLAPVDHRLDSRLSETWRCTSCGRFHLYPQRRSNPRECRSCGHAQLVPATVHLSFWRLMDG
jgi:hypothetical protein